MSLLYKAWQDYCRRQYYYWKNIRQYRYKGWGYKYTAWFYMKWFKIFLSVVLLCLVSALKVDKAFADVGVQQVYYSTSNENVVIDATCPAHTFEIVRASDSAVMTDGSVGCTGTNPATVIVAPGDILIGSMPYSGDYYISADSVNSSVFTLVSGDYSPAPTPTATISAMPATYIDIASSSAISYGINGIMQVIFNIGLILVIAAGFQLGMLLYRL